MAQPIKNIIKSTKKTTKKRAKKLTDPRIPPKQVNGASKKVRKHQEFGTSKLEERFAHNFLDKLGVDYIYQFKAASIGRYYDFYIPSANLLIEIDGDYYHSHGLVYEEMSPMQKRNKRVDKQKDHWAYANCIPLIRIWEHDINNHPEKVMEMLKKEIGVSTKKKIIDDNKKKRH